MNRRSLVRNLGGAALLASMSDPLHAQLRLGGGGPPSLVGNTYFVGTAGCPYTTVAAAIAAINGGSPPTFTNWATIYVYPGTYTSTSAMVVPQYVNIVGIGKWGSPILVNNTTDLFTCSGFNRFQNLTIVQGTTASTWAFNVGNNTDVAVFDCQMYGSTSNVMGLLSADGTSWARITIQDCLVNSLATSGYICSFVNRTTTVRFCDTWIRNCFFDAYSLTSSGGSIIAWGVQDFRVECCTLRGANTFNTSVYLGKAPITSGTPQVEIRHCYTTGGTSIFNESGTEMIVLNSDCAGASFSGTLVNHNSYVGAAYNPLGPI